MLQPLHGIFGIEVNMAIQGTIDYKHIEFRNAYIAYYSHTIHKLSENHIDNIGNHTYCVDIEVHIFADHTKEMLLSVDTIKYQTNDVKDLTFNKLWNIIKNKYQGIDIL